MAVKKKPAKQSAKKPLVKQVLPKPVPVVKRKKVVRKPKDRRMNLPRPGFVSAVWGGEMPDGRSAVHIAVSPDAHIDRLVVTVNGRGIWEGQP